MPPKNVKLENAVFYTADGRKIGKLADFEIEAPELTECPPEFLKKELHLDPIEGSFEATLTPDGLSFFKQMEYETAIEWVTIMRRPRNAHLAKYGKNRRIRKKNADYCLHIFRRDIKGGEGRGYKVY